MPDDAAIEVAEWRAIVERDEEAFNRWFARCEDRLRRSLQSFAASVDVEAVVQETGFQIWQHDAARIRPDGTPNFLLRWACIVARRQAINIAKRHRRSIPLEPDAEGIALTAETRADPFLRTRIRQCVEKLPEQSRRTIAARIRDDGRHSDRELATAIGFRFDTFRQNLARGRRALVDCLLTLGIRIGAHPMVDRERTMLIEEATTAWRPRTPDRQVLEHPAWADLDAAGRTAAFMETLAMRGLEAALDPDGYSTTVRSVAAVIARR